MIKFSFFGARNSYKGKMTDFKSTMTKLNGTNYAAWSQKMEDFLIRDEVWDAVSKETATLPNPAWIKNDNQARIAIILYMKDDQLLHIQGTSTALFLAEVKKSPSTIDNSEYDASIHQAF